MKKEYLEQKIGWVCQDCGKKALTYKMNAGKKRLTMSTWHMGECSVCGERKPVTENRDFGYPFYPKRMFKDGVQKTSPQGNIFDAI